MAEVDITKASEIRVPVYSRRVRILAIVSGLYSKQAYLSSTPRLAIGKSSDGWQHTSSTGFSPPAGSLSAVLIACDGFTLENAITLGL